MTGTLPLLDEMLTEARENTVAALLAAQARALNAGAEIEAEPVRRDPNGAVMRVGRLDLPSRGDLSVSYQGRTLIQRVESADTPLFEQVAARNGDGFSALISPFHWDDARITFLARVGTPNWTPLRLWFLEWFQPRQSPLQPDLAGVVHSFDGPHKAETGWTARADFGSAPITAISDLVEAASGTGCSAMTVGGASDH